MKNRLADNARLLRAPILLLTMPGDAFAGENGCLRLVQCVPNAQVIRRHLDAGELMGHFDYFRRRNAPLWSIVSNYLKTDVA
jgi:predicted alpha/beta hydrolase